MKTKKITLLNVILTFVLILISSCADTNSSTPNIPENIKDIDDEIAAAIEEAKETEEPTTEEIDPYAHVRFGETRDILLLDIEWHTYDTYLEEIVEPYRKEIEELQNSGEYDALSDDEKYMYDLNLTTYERELSLIPDNRVYAARTINGKYFDKVTYTLWDPNIPIDISEYLDEDGYYIFNIYPYNGLAIGYSDENGEFQYKSFSSDGSGRIRSRSDFENVMKEQVIPFCDDLLARKRIDREFYDSFTTFDPLDEYVEAYFS